MRSFWLHLRSHDSFGGVPHRRLEYVRTSTGDLITQPDAVRETCALFYEELYAVPVSAPSLQHPALASAQALPVDAFGPDACLAPLSLDELHAELDRVGQDEKAPGFDGVRPQHLRLLDAGNRALLRVAVNTFLLHPGGSDHDDDVLLLSPVPKSDDHCHMLGNFRPIALLNTVPRVALRVVSRRVFVVLERMRLFGDVQQAFRPSGNIEWLHQVLQVRIQRAAGAHTPLFIALLDISKAYDNVPHTSLFHALEAYGFPAAIRHFVRGMYASVRARVITAHGLSRAFPVCRGVRQGDPLSCALFLLVLQPLLQYLDRTEVVADGGPACMAFADDLLVVGASLAELRRRLAVVEAYLRAVGLSLSASKSLVVGNATARAAVPPQATVHVAGHQLPVLGGVFTYLGVVFHPDGVRAGGAARVLGMQLVRRLRLAIHRTPRVPLPVETATTFNAAAVGACLRTLLCWPPLLVSR
jgi:hypothetical protein